VEKGAQKLAQPAQEQTEVVAGGGEHGVDAVAVAALEVIATHAVLGFEMADDRLDRGTVLHLTADRTGHAAHVADDPDAAFVGVVVAAIAPVDMNVGLAQRRQHVCINQRHALVAAIKALGVELRVFADYEIFRDTAPAVDDDVVEPRATANFDVGQQHCASGPGMGIDAAIGEQ